MADSDNPDDINCSGEVNGGQPLFPAAGQSSCLFPSAQVLQSQREAAQDKVGNGGEDLASLQLELSSSTLDAILAAQRPLPNKPTDTLDRNSAQSLDSTCETGVTRKKRSSPSEDDSKSSDDDLRHTQKKKRKKEHHKKKKKKKHKHQSKQRSRSPSPLKSEEVKLPFIPKGKVFLEDIPNLRPEHAYHLDRKANKDLWHYQSVSKQHLPKYRHLCDNCLGNVNVFVKEKRQAKKAASKSNRYFGKESRRLLRKRGLRVGSETDNERADQVRAYLPLPKVATEEESHTQRDVGTYSCLDEATKLYSQGKGINPPDTDKENFLMDEIFQKVAFFNQQTREDPTNIQQWMDFVAFQDVVAQEDKGFKGETVRLREVYQPSRAVIEKKLAILEKALAANPSSMELKLAQLELYQDVWEEEKLEKAWEDLLFVHSANVDVWRQYLTRQQTRLSRFTFSHMVKLYHKCFKTLSPILDGKVKVINTPPDLEQKMIALFRQYCDYLCHCGYVERAIASYQAMIEFNLYCPPALNLSTTSQRAPLFEEFWESGVAKFGELNASGWAKWMEEKDSATASPSVRVSSDALEDAIINQQQSRAQTWLSLERIRGRIHMLPWRPDEAQGESEESLEDLDRLVLIDDISPALFTLSQSDSCVKVVCMFLRFLGLHSDRLDSVLRDKESGGDEFLQYSLTSPHHVPEITAFNVGRDLKSDWRLESHLVTFLRSVLQQAESYFGVTNRTLFTHLRLELEVRKTGVLKASQLSKGDAKEVKKYGKSLLKEHQNRNNLTVWDAFIRLQWACSDKMAETVSMIEVALGMFMGSSVAPDQKRMVGLAHLCRTYTQILLNFEPLEHMVVKGKHSAPTMEDKGLAMACLGNFLENKSFKSTKLSEVTPAFILRIQRRFVRKLEDLVKSSEDQDLPLMAAVVECQALFELCASNLRAANSAYASAIDIVKHHSSLQDHKARLSLLHSLYLSNIDLVTNVMHIDNVPLKEVRTLVDNALQEFPQSPQLHSALISIESGSYMAGRLRKFYERQLKQPRSVLCPLFAVTSELVRHDVVRSSTSADGFTGPALYDSGTVHRVKAVFEQILQRPSCRHCPLIWRLYLYFESSCGSPTGSKGVLYRGLQNCPWVKDLYLDGVSIFGESELQEMTDLLTEKELRVCMPVEEADLLMTAHREDEEGEGELEEIKQEVKVEDEGEDEME